MEKCKSCFWNDVNLKNWPDFEGRRDIDKEEQIKRIKEKKCQECKSGVDNYAKVWLCKECNKKIEGHNYHWHGSYCDDCWETAIR